MAKKLIKGEMHCRFSHLEYEFRGKWYSADGEFYYNESRKRFEHTHIGPRGGEYLVVVPHKF